jgi:hypothetical protein
MSMSSNFRLVRVSIRLISPISDEQTAANYKNTGSGQVTFAAAYRRSDFRSEFATQVDCLPGGMSNTIGRSLREGAIRSKHRRNAGPSPDLANSIALRVMLSASPSSKASIARVVLLRDAMTFALYWPLTSLRKPMGAFFDSIRAVISNISSYGPSLRCSGLSAPSVGRPDGSSHRIVLHGSTTIRFVTRGRRGCDVTAVLMCKDWSRQATGGTRDRRHAMLMQSLARSGGLMICRTWSGTQRDEIPRIFHEAADTGTAKAAGTHAATLSRCLAGREHWSLSSGVGDHRMGDRVFGGRFQRSRRVPLQSGQRLSPPRDTPRYASRPFTDWSPRPTLDQGGT